MKKILVPLQTLLLALCLTAASGASQLDQTNAVVPAASRISAENRNNKELVVGYVISNFNDTFQTIMYDGCVAYAEKNGIKLVTADAQEDIVKQQDSVNALITQGVDGLIVVPVDTSAVAPITKAAQDANIPLCYLNRRPYVGSEIPKGIYYVGTRDIEGGIMQMEFIGELIGGKGGICILQGVLADEAAMQRTEGNEKVAAEKYPDIVILAKESGNFQRDQGMNITQNWLTAYGDKISAIVSNNDEMALGAINALNEAGRGNVPVIGLDGTGDALKAIKEGKLTATIFQNGPGLGAKSLEVIVAILSGESVGQENIIPYKLITAENVAEFK